MAAEDELLTFKQSNEKDSGQDLMQNVLTKRTHTQTHIHTHTQPHTHTHTHTKEGQYVNIRDKTHPV